MQPAKPTIVAAIEEWPRTTCYAVAGFAIGAFAGWIIGGVGVAARGHAVGIQTDLVLAIAGAVLGG